MHQKKLAIIIINWNGWKDTVECLESIFNSTWRHFSVIVIDNGSKDNSLHQITSWARSRFEIKRYNLSDIETKNINFEYNYPIILIKSEENQGFARGCNIGIKYAINAGFRRALLLNNDTIVKPDCLEILDDFSNNNPEFPVLTPLINYYDRHEIVWCFGGKLTFTGRRYFNYGNKHQNKIRKKYKQVTFISGCALYANIDIFKQFGLLTEKFFFGEEDYHFSYVMKKNNVKMAAVASAVIFHKIGASHIKILDQLKLPYKFIGYLNRFIDKKLFCKSFIYWKFWRFLNIIYITPKLILVDRYSFKKVLYFIKLLIQYSNNQNKVNKDLFFKIKEDFC